MLNRVRLENFKAWREADLTLGKVTGFFGTNSAGKSSLLQFLLLLKQTKNATDSGWGEQEALIERVGVRLDQLCPKHAFKATRRQQ